MAVLNRLVMPAMGIHFGADEQGNVTPQLSEYYALRAKGEVGMIIAGAVAVSPTGKDLAVQMSIWDDRFIPALKKLTDHVHASGHTKIGTQLLHGGRQVSHDDKVAPSPIPSLAVVKGMPRELSVKEISEVVETFGDSARRSKDAGFDFVEIHAAHGYLIGEFLSPVSNHRSDAYGGSYQNRIRFLIEILHDIKDKTDNDFPVGIRINGDDYISGSWTIDDAKRLAPILEENGADYLNISAGIYGAPPPGVTIPSMYGEYGCFVHLAESVKKEVSIPVITAGRIKDPEFADQIIRSGKADMVAMGRALLADPFLPAKAKTGNAHEIRPCIGCCLGCIQNVWVADEATCVMNPEVNREYLFLGKDTVSTPKKILVLGAGPSALGFASAAAKRGHHIIIVEEKGHIGGMLPVASKPPGRSEFMELVEYYQKELHKLGVEIRLNVTLNKDLVDKIKPDAVIMATGSLPDIPQFSGLFNTCMEVHTVVEVLERSYLTGDRVIMLGGNQAGLETADYLSEMGKDVVVLEQGDHFADEMAANDRTYLRERLKRPNVKLYKKVSIRSFLPTGVVFQYKGNEVSLEGFDDVVISTGMRSVRHAANIFKNSDIEVYFIGDAKGTRTLLDSQIQAYDLGISI